MEKIDEQLRREQLNRGRGCSCTSTVCTICSGVFSALSAQYSAAAEEAPAVLGSQTQWKTKLYLGYPGCPRLPSPDFALISPVALVVSAVSDASEGGQKLARQPRLPLPDRPTSPDPTSPICLA
ncbi:hypothetical protein NDU88_005345 [Pleurodeles waltl]|uniref:Uncharacterized protein n=1 Tax=Pleurodeles waltl TaxID=8319 RepID=A0AAV7TC92_PLEWA|nr:hypothetical protein NDU88_005345 [Pleurodeles waltl]